MWTWKNKKFCNFADDSTIYSYGNDLPKIKVNLICTIQNILQ